MTATDRAAYLDRSRVSIAMSWLMALGGTAFTLMLELATFALEWVFPAPERRFADVSGAMGMFLGVMALIGVAGLLSTMRRVIASLPDAPSPRQGT